MLRAVLWAGLLSGACSFVYEIGWIRLLNQALGTTVHSFELMLASFLLGLAGGGAWVHRRGARLDDPLRTAGHAQVAMGVAALLSLLAFAQSFDWTAALVQALSRTDGGYQLFLLGSAGVAMAVMLPAAFFAGTTLPLSPWPCCAAAAARPRSAGCTRPTPWAPSPACCWPHMYCCRCWACALA
ncbi:hypothetical protein [Pseudoxanthomonas suwonensis]